MLKELIVTAAVVFTGYSNEPRQTDSTPNITAFQNKVHHCGIAVSRDLEDQGFKEGCRVQTSGIKSPLIRLDGAPYCGGVYLVNDRMHWRWKSKADLFFFDNSKAWKFGKQTGHITLLWCEKS